MEEQNVMLCPNCLQGDFYLDKVDDMWKCTCCEFELENEEFDDEYIFWFCDNCGTFLNRQIGFDRYAKKHICAICGCENDMSLASIKDYEESSDEGVKHGGVKEWFKANKGKFAAGGAAVAVALLAVLGAKNAGYKAKINDLNFDNLAKGKRIKELIELCDAKDEVFNKVIADGLRHGSPVAAQQMAWKREFIKDIAKQLKDW